MPGIDSTGIKFRENERLKRLGMLKQPEPFHHEPIIPDPPEHDYTKYMLDQAKKRNTGRAPRETRMWAEIEAEIDYEYGNKTFIMPHYSRRDR